MFLYLQCSGIQSDDENTFRVKQCKSPTEMCTKSKSKIVIEGTFTSLVIDAKESSSI